MPPEPCNDFEEKLLANIENHGLQVNNIFGEGELPNFSYSVGLWHTYKHPEIIIIGLKSEIAHWIMNEIGRRCREKIAPLETDRKYEGFLEGFDVIFFDVPKRHYREFVGSDLWLYGGDDFPLMQCVWPSTKGAFPWEEKASEWFRNWQPVLKDTEEILVRFPDSQMEVVVCGHVFRKERPVKVAHHFDNGGWSFTCGEIDHEGDTSLEIDRHNVAIKELLDEDPSLHMLADLRRGFTADRHKADGAWERFSLDDIEE